MGNLAMYATKGFEYLLILGFLALLTAFYLYFTSQRFEKVTAAISSSVDQLVDWFRVPENILYHQGHTWIRPEKSSPGLVRVGMDDFARKLLGRIDSVDFPKVGMHVTAGVIYLMWVAIRVKKGVYERRGNNYEIVEIAGLYWHFVDLVWVFIFAFFYLW